MRRVEDEVRIRLACHRGRCARIGKELRKNVRISILLILILIVSDVLNWSPWIVSIITILTILFVLFSIESANEHRKAHNEHK
ncbi:MAG: hypothetical protein QG607_399 [Patescibacteria group bacterium]|jgi:Ca2+/Na+ antiporter|nr:hypothetical protein [Patescibacteria group bacterium]